MKSIVTAGAMLLAAATIAGCSQKAQNESAEAGNAIAADTAAMPARRPRMR